MSEWSFCKCGNPKSPAAVECRDCYLGRVSDGLGELVSQVPVDQGTGDPVRDAFEWLIAQSRGKIS